VTDGFFFSDANLLKDSLERFVQQISVQRGRRSSNRTWVQRKEWQTFAELGWLGVPFAEKMAVVAAPDETMAIWSNSAAVCRAVRRTSCRRGMLASAGKARRRIVTSHRSSPGPRNAFAFVERSFNLADLTTTAQKTTRAMS
jgi:hypothetical protein